ncbi:MAG: hypothetical protein JJ713_10360 [Acidithiobacillus sp.]|uniref:hypothetical protein n=1 Tax=Acidithiobacillus sp. TaxID=1872118 RepID=UPI002589E2F0|nr:hypothetical protein [Acidithiobacillus sp.]MCE5421156.1 hypothetical protein [Acidithiobacillus sp.]
MNTSACPIAHPNRVAIALIAAIGIGTFAAMTWPRQAHAGMIGSFVGHAAAAATGAVVAHETERDLDRRRERSEDRQPGDAPDIAHDGRIGLVFPAAAALPNPRLTPGARNPAVTQANLRETICRPGGYTRSIRPDEHYTEQLKRRQIREYGYPQQMGHDAFRLSNYEEDHLISLELGGSPDSPRNLWPEPHHVIGGWGSYVKDQLENRLHTMVCHHQISLAQAQDMIAHNWIAAYQRYISPTPVQKRSHRYGG